MQNSIYSGKACETVRHNVIYLGQVSQLLLRRLLGSHRGVLFQLLAGVSVEWPLFYFVRS